MPRLILGFVGLKAAGMKRRAPPGGPFGIGFACRRGGEVRPGFSDAQFELPHSAKAIGFGLGLRLGARPFKVGQAPRERVSLERGCAYLPLQLCEPGIVGERVLNAADSFASFDPGAGRCDRGSGDPVDGRTDHGKARIDDRVAAYSDNELLIESEHSRSEQHHAENEFGEAAPRQSPFAENAQPGDCAGIRFGRNGVVYVLGIGLRTAPLGRHLLRG